MLLGRPEPQPFPAPPFRGMQVTPALLKDLYSEPSLEAATKKPEKALPGYRWSRTRNPRHVAQTKAAPAFSLVFFFPPRLALEEQTPSSSAALSRKFLSARGRPTGGDFIT